MENFIFCAVTWVAPLKDKKGITVTNTFENNLDQSNCKPSKIWLDNGNEFYNKIMVAT